MRFLLLALGWMLLLGGCGPSVPQLQLVDDCRGVNSQEQLIANNWRQQPRIWRLRQTALLEIGPKKIPLQGFLRLDLQQHEARLLALNEMGLVLFDLQVDDQGQKLLRAIPQIRQKNAVAKGVGASLRQIFLQPQPAASDLLQSDGNSQRLQRTVADGQLEFVFDCAGDLRQTRLQATSSTWQVLYSDYRSYPELSGARLPGLIVFNDESHRVKLSLWQKEVKQER